jgi:hypothetical protein
MYVVTTEPGAAGLAAVIGALEGVKKVPLPAAVVMA